MPINNPKGPHASEHQDGGIDEISLAGLSGLALDGLDDVSVPTPTNGYFVYWDAATSLWKCRALTAADIPTLDHGGLSGLADDDHIIYLLADGSRKIVTDAALTFGTHLYAPQIRSHSDYMANILELHQPEAGKFMTVGLSGNGSELVIYDGTDIHNAGWANLYVLNSSRSMVIEGGKDGTGLAVTNCYFKLDTMPYSNNTYILGHPNSRWKDIYAVNLHGAVAATDIPANIKTASLTFIIDGAGSAITTGEKGHLEIPFACTIKQVTMLADASGSIVVDIWKDTYANFPPTDADSITSTHPPTITTAQKSQDATLTGWTTAIAAGDILAFNVDSCTTITRVTLSLKVEKT